MTQPIELIIGIDPGTTTGVALYDAVSETLLELHTMDFWSAFTWCSMSAAKVVCIEVPKNKRIFHKAGSDLAANQVTARKVGGVIRESELLADGLEKIGKKVIRIEPLGKMDHEKFCRLTGWDVKKRTNGHARDAALQIYRRGTGRRT